MFDIATITQPYLTRNQDRLAVIEHPAGRVLAIADGAGGTSGGADAADTAILWTRAHVERAADLNSSDQWLELLAYTDRQISCADGETTLVVVAIHPDGLCGASVGDSAAWLIGDDGRCDDLTAQQVHKPLIGKGNARAVVFERASFTGTLLLATDGLIKYAPRQRLCQLAMLPNLQEASRALLDCVRLKSGALHDDTSLILCRRSRAKDSVAYTGRKRYTLTDDGELLEE